MIPLYSPFMFSVHTLLLQILFSVHGLEFFPVGLFYLV